MQGIHELHSQARRAHMAETQLAKVSTVAIIKDPVRWSKASLKNNQRPSPGPLGTSQRDLVSRPII
jgi:hypothetical protein